MSAATLSCPPTLMGAPDGTRVKNEGGLRMSPCPPALLNKPPRTRVLCLPDTRIYASSSVECCLWSDHEKSPHYELGNVWTENGLPKAALHPCSPNIYLAHTRRRCANVCQRMELYKVTGSKTTAYHFTDNFKIAEVQWPGSVRFVCSKRRRSSIQNYVS